jgi:choline-sulfatase
MKNLLFITADEMRGDCLAANRLNPDIRTPHLDALAAEGVNFTRHFTTFPKCVPARASLTTGRYCHTDGYRDIFQHLPASAPDLLSTLLARGYEAALFGKNHCWENLLEATHTPPTLAPGQSGHRIAHHSWTGPFKLLYDQLQSELAPSPALLKAHHDDLVKPIDTHWGDEAYTRQAIHFLDTVRDRDRPFYLHVNIESPHPSYIAQPADSPFHYDPAAITPFPHDEPDRAPLSLRAQREVRLAGHRDEASLRRIQAAYYGMISRVDDQIGRILAALDARGLRDDTVVVFLSDHGDFAGQYRLREKWDTTFADCLLHVPLIVRAPGLPVGHTVATVTDHTDIAPTLCELLDLPPLPGAHGHSLLPAIAGRPLRDAAFADGGHEPALRARMETTNRDGDKQETYARHPDAMARAMSVRTATHKLVWRETGDHELYDLAADRWELDNRYADAALRPVRESLMARLLDWRLRTAPDRPVPDRVGA